MTFAQARIRVLAPGTTPTPPPTSRVYLQVLSASNAGLAAPIDSSLKQVGLHLERGTNGRTYEVVDSAKTIGEVRYFTAADEALAKRVQTAVEGALAANGIYQRLTPQLVRLAQSSTGVRRSGLVRDLASDAERTIEGSTTTASIPAEWLADVESRARRAWRFVRADQGTPLCGRERSCHTTTCLLHEPARSVSFPLAPRRRR